MNFSLPYPNPGDKISANLIREIIRAIRSLTPIGGPGILTSHGPNGTVYRTAGRKDPVKKTILPWTFSCYEDEDTNEKVGGWKNCILQLGYNYWLFSPDIYDEYDRGTATFDNVHSGTIEGTDRTDDGSYVVEINLMRREATIKLKSEASYVYPVDEDHHIVYIDIGHVEYSEQKTRIPNHPVVYMYV